jgi:hypothetical protein
VTSVEATNVCVPTLCALEERCKEEKFVVTRQLHVLEALFRKSKCPVQLKQIFFREWNSLS